MVVADSRTPRDGRIIEEIGTYNPVKDDKAITLDVERAKYWLSVGAQPPRRSRPCCARAARSSKAFFPATLRHWKEGAVMAELVKYIACCLVDHPDLVEVREVPGDQALILELRVAPEDMGKVIGKQGRIAKAIRVVMRAAAVRQGEKVIVEID